MTKEIIAQNRIFGYDLMKAIAMTCVVIYHLGSLDFGKVPEVGYYLPNITKFFYSILACSVPLFFMVTGALVSNKEISFRKASIRVGKILFISAFWTIVFGYILNPIILGKDMPNAWGFYNYYWFMYSLAFLYVVHYALQASNKLKLIVVSLLLIVPFLSNFYWDIKVFILPDTTIPEWGHTGLFSLYSIVPFYMGGVMSKYSVNKCWSIFLIVIGLLLVNFEVVAFSTHDNVVFDGVNHSFPTIGALCMAIGVFHLLREVQFVSYPKFSRVVMTIGSNTAGIYIFHMFFVSCVKEYVFKQEMQHPFVVLACAFVIVSLTTVISLIIKKTRFKILLTT